VRLAAKLGDSPVAAEVIEALAVSVAGEPEERPSARDFALTLDRLARQVGGVSLRAFAADVVPGLMPSTDTQFTDSSVLIEGEVARTTATSTAPAAQVGSLAAAREGTSTYDAAIDVEDPPAAAAIAAPSSRGGAGALIGAVVLLSAFGVALVGGLALWGSGALSPSAPEPAVAAVAVPEEPAAAPQPAPVPVPVPEPAFEAAPEAETPPQAPPQAPPPSPAATPPRTSTPRGPVAAPAAVPAPEPTPLPADTPRVPSAKVVVADASSFTVTCGDVSRSGTTNVPLRDAPVGRCEVKAQVLDRSLTGSFHLQEKAEILCAAVDGSLQCAPR
jgi:hypothetical protein